MKNPELFHKTVGILVNAYLNDTLEHGQPCGCAVGNLIAANNSYGIYKREGDNWLFQFGAVHRNANWTEVHAYGKMRENPIIDAAYGRGIDELLSTGYDTAQTCMIEQAFESPLFTNGKYDGDKEGQDPTGYLGLMAVCDTLMKIHEANEEEITQAKSLFVKELAV